MADPRSAQALVKRNSADEIALMPPPPFKRIKRPAKVLDEDDYTAALSEIIARDYFPGLLETQAQHEYLAALDSGNDAWIAETARKLREAATPSSNSRRRSARNTRFDATPSATPSRPTSAAVADTPIGDTGGETPATVAGSEAGRDDQESRQEEQLDTSSLSLGSFQAKYTSEDNESFNALLDKQNLKRREKHAYMWTQDQRLLSARQIAHRAREARLLQQQEDDAAAGKSLVPITAGATESRPAKPDSWKIKRPDNGFMFTGSSVDEEGLQTVQEVKELNSKAGPKHVVHTNTRFPPIQYTEDPGPVPASPSLNTEIIAERSRRQVAAPESETDYGGGETPRVNGYAFVDEDEPENLPQASSQPSYRDLLAGQADAGPNPFTISSLRRREDLHLRMVEKQAKGKRERARDTLRPTTPGSNMSSATGAMTPAARRLMEKIGERTPVSGGGGSGRTTGKASTENMWTPGRTPRRKTTGK